MAWLLGLADRISPGAWPFVVLNSALFSGSLFAFAALEPRPRPVALPLILLCTISPLVLIYQGDILKDVLFANTALAGFAALAWAGRDWERPSRRFALLLLAVLLFALAALARQNGFVAALFGALAIVAIALTRPPAAGRRTSRIAGALGLGALAVALVALVHGVATMALESHGDGRRETLNHAKVLQVFDLAGAVSLRPSLPLPVLHMERPDLERFLREEAAPHYRAAGSDNLADLPGGATMVTPSGGAAGKQWAQLFLRTPGLYLSVRTRVWMITLLTPASARCPMIFTGIDGGDVDLLRAAGLKAREDDKDDWDSDYASAFLGTPVFSHAFYGAVILLVLGLSARRWARGDRSSGLLAAVALGLAGLAFAASFFVLSIDCDYRFLYFTDVAAMVVAVREAAARGPQSSKG
jgi:hypothetical protein